MAFSSFFIFLAIVVVVASTGILFKPGEWYDQLTKPDWTPPNWMFPVVWSVLYLFIALAGWYVFKAQGFGLLLGLWGLQMVLNMAWSWLFFGRHQMLAGLIDIVLLALVIAVFIFLAWGQVPMAAYLFVPYLVWVLVAMMLNHQLWVLNRET